MNKSFSLMNNNNQHTLFVAESKKQFLNQFRYKQLLDDVYENLSSLNYVFIKGDVLSLLAYGTVGVRSFSDIDILVPRKEISAVEEILTQKGYVAKTNISEQRLARVLCLSSSHQFPAVCKKAKGINIEVDLNFDLFWGEYTGKRINMNEFLSEPAYMDIYGYKIKVLSPIKSMIQLILHHYKEMNSIYHLAGHNCINYNMFKDLYYLWKNNQEDISLEKLHDISTAYKIEPFVYYMLFFTNQIFKDEELNEYVLAFKCLHGVNLLEYYGLSANERKPWRVDFKTRLETDNLFELIKDDLTDFDIEKLKRSRSIFG